LAEVAATYVNIRTTQERLRYVVANVELQKGSLAIAQAQAEGGQVSEVDVRQAELIVANTQANVPALTASLRQQNNLLCFLLGRPTENLLPQLGKGPIPTAPASVAIGIPGELLRRRPDIRRAEREVAAQSAQIGIAESDLYPHFSIAGQIGWQAQDLGSAFGPNGNFGVISPGLSWDVLNYGRFKNNIEAQKASFQALALAYQNTVLNANQEVENNIASFLTAQERTRFSAQGVKAAVGGVDLVTTQYQNGAINYNTVFNLQLSLVGQQDELAVAQGDIALGLIGTYKALGGGWQIRCDGAGMMVAAAAPPSQGKTDDDSMLPPPPAIEPENGDSKAEDSKAGDSSYLRTQPGELYSSYFGTN
jgi:NodT family efflux transporter outer membrane factor (OMF) lipoprotein